AAKKQDQAYDEPRRGWQLPKDAERKEPVEDDAKRDDGEQENRREDEGGGRGFLLVRRGRGRDFKLSYPVGGPKGALRGPRRRAAGMPRSSCSPRSDRRAPPASPLPPRFATLLATASLTTTSRWSSFAISAVRATSFTERPRMPNFRRSDVPALPNTTSP